MLKLQVDYKWLYTASVVVGAISLVGVVIFILSHAASVVISSEPEQGIVTGQATVTHDPTASSGASITFAPCTGNPTAPTNFKLTATNTPSVDLEWTASKPAQNCTLAGYKFWRATGAAAPATTGTPYASALVGTTYANTNVALSTTYTYTLVAYDKAGHQSAPVSKTATTPDAISAWTWPVHKEDLKDPSAGLTQCWLHYYSPRDSYHAAIDIGVNYKPVYAAHAGTVVGKYSDGYNTLIINTGKDSDTGKTLYAVYEHMSSITINNGATVTKGQRIGTSGEVGAPGAPHLHFGISDSATNFGTYANPWHTANPLDFLPVDYAAALQTNDSYSCKTSSIKSRSDYGFTKYKTSGTFSMYK